MRNHIVSRLIHSHNHVDRLILQQLQQAWSRIGFAIAGLAYIFLHGEYLARYETIFLYAATLFFIYNILTLYTIRRTPLSAFRMLFGPLLDVSLVGLGMMIDGGQTSSLYLVLFIIIFGNAMRFGNTMLLYSQALSLITVITVTLSTLSGLNLELDGVMLFMQCAALLVGPAYVMQITKQVTTAVQARQEAEKATFGLLDHGLLPAFTFQLGDDGMPRILYANLAMQHIYRDSVMDLVGEQVDIIALMEDGDEIIRSCQQVFADDENIEPHRFYIRGRDSDDHILQLMGQSMRLHWRGKWIGVCFLFDITATEAARIQLENSIHSSFTNTLVSGIVHDFRNVLTSMIGTAEVMSFTHQDEETQKQLKLIMDAGERGSSLVSHLLNLGKVKHEHPTELPTSDAIHQSLFSIVGLLRIQLPPHVQLHLDIQGKFTGVSITLVEIEQIVSNLINNSTQAIVKTGHISVSLYVSREHALPNHEGPALCIRVRDNGRGIVKSDIAEITKPFWTSRQDEGGTGLGLAMVQRIVRSHGGVLNIESTLGKGTDIHVYLPMRNNADEEADNKNTTESVDDTFAPDGDLVPTACHILLVDDSPEVLAIHRAQLERMGHTVFVANDGAEGLEQLEQHRDEIDILITDYQMPKMDGLDFAVAAQALKPKLPVLIITAYGESLKLQQAATLGIGILNKPATYKKLSQTIAAMQKDAAQRDPAA